MADEGLQWSNLLHLLSLKSFVYMNWNDYVESIARFATKFGTLCPARKSRRIKTEVRDCFETKLESFLQVSAIVEALIRIYIFSNFR